MLRIRRGLDGKGTGAGIEGGNTDHAISNIERSERHQVVCCAGVERALIDQRTGSDDAGQAALYDAFRGLRIFQLIHDRHAFAGGEQSRQVRRQTVMRHAGHGDGVVGVLVAAGQRDTGVARQFLGVAHERFVKIAHAHQQHGIRMRRFGFQVLAHHRGVGR